MSEEKLDDKVEQAIEDLAYRAYWEGKNQSTGTFKNERINEKRIALRSRIRILVQEARDDAIAQCEANR